MKIENAVNISDLINSKLNIRCSEVSLQSLEELFVDSGLDEGSFGMVRLTYADAMAEVYFDYPTDMAVEQAELFAETVISAKSYKKN